ncbi:probable glutamate receptor [Penaeus vannamei]|uniref:probable glutamate receptor n=1 Tax=Penaeus vannamei TaxID=6689 RepID=UPI00387F518A
MRGNFTTFLRARMSRISEARTAHALLASLAAHWSGPHVLLVHDDSARDVVPAIRSSHLNGGHLTIATYDPHLKILDAFIRSYGEVTVARQVVVLCNMEHTLQLLRQVRTRALESLLVQWFLIPQDHVIGDVIGSIESELREGLQVVVFLKDSANVYKVTSVRVDPTGQPRLVSVGKWQRPDAGPPQLQLKDALLPDLLKLYSDFQGRELVVSVNNNWPFFGITRLADGRVVPDSGIDVNILNTFSQKLNFSYRIEPPPDNSWGGPQPDGSVTGLIGMTARQEAHFAICEITITETRETVVDFTAPYWLEALTLVSRAPEERDRSMAVFWPFSWLVWVCIVLSSVVVGPLVSASAWATERYLEEAKPRPSLQASVFSLFRSLVVQGNLLQADRWPLRFIFVFWYFYCYNIYAMYSGTLTAVLAIPAFEKPLDTLEDLPPAAEEGFKVGTLRASSTEFLFRYAESGIYKEVWDLFDGEESLLKTPEEGFDKVLSEKFVLINSQLNAEIRAAVRGRGRYHMGRDSFYPHGYGIACFSGAPFKPIFDVMLARINEGGMITKWAQEEILKVAGKEKGAKGEAEKEGNYSLTLLHLRAAFFLLLAGMAVSACAFLGEMVMSVASRSDSA